MKLKFKGKLEIGDGSRVLDDIPWGMIHIDGQDVLGEISDTFRNGEQVTIGLADETFDGELFTDIGWGYSEWTPMDHDNFFIGDHDFLNILSKHEGEEVTLFVADEPINVLED